MSLDDPFDDILNRPARQPRPPITYVCTRHGEYPENWRAFGPDRAVCPACIETGKALLGPWKQAWDQHARWQRTRAPERFRNRRLGNYRPADKTAAQALAAARQVASGNMQALALIGTVGTGKTHLGVGILAEVVRSGRTGLWVHVPSLLRDWRATFDKRSESTQEQLIETLNTPDVLVLDEVGADRADRSDWSLDQISMLIDERYRDGGAIVVTGNVSDLAAGIGGRGADRFDEMGVVIAMVGPSYRSKAADDPALQVPDDFTEPPARIEWTVCDAGVDRVEVRDRRPPGSGRQSHQELRL